MAIATLLPYLQPQEIPFDHPDSRYMFDDQSFVATAAAMEMHGPDLARCLNTLQALAREKNGGDNGDTACHFREFRSVAD